MKPFLLLLLLGTFLFGEDVKPDRINVLIKYVVHDSHTDVWIETIDGPLENHELKIWEQINRPLTEIDWSNYKKLGYIILYIKITNTWI